jgi:hypothetical protein
MIILNRPYIIISMILLKAKLSIRAVELQRCPSEFPVLIKHKVYSWISSVSCLFTDGMLYTRARVKRNTRVNGNIIAMTMNLFVSAVCAMVVF